MKRPVHRLGLTALVLLLAGGCSSPEDQWRDGPAEFPPVDLENPPLAAPTWELLASAPKWRILRLDTLPRAVYETTDMDAPSSEWFHDYAVLASADLVDANARRAAQSFLRSGIEANGGEVAGCFNPRHGISAELDGRRVDLVICFECLQIRVYDGGGERIEDALVESFPSENINNIWASAGI